MKRERKNPKDRKNSILAAACTVAVSKGYTNVTREDAAKAAGVSMSLVSHYFSTMPQLKRDLMRYAVRCGVSAVIAQGLMHRDPQAMKLDKDKKREILATLAD